MKISLKLKILLATSILVVICTAFNLGYSYKLFTEDKTSYIFESGLKKAENISDQINFKLNDARIRTNLYAGLASNSSVDLERFINDQDEVIATGMVAKNETGLIVEKSYFNQVKLNQLVNNFSINTQELESALLLKAKDLNTKVKESDIIINLKNKVRILFHFSQKDDFTFFTITDLSTTVEMFAKDQTYSNKIISLTDKKEKAIYIDWLTSINYDSSKKGVFESQIEGKDLLISYSFANKDLLVISSIDKEKAFGITKFLILKTSIFALFLIGGAIIIGIYFSSSITLPIKKLTAIAQKVAEGDFSIKAEIKTSDEISILGNTFNFMSEEIQSLLKNKEDLIAELENYSKNLEQMVEQRTAELKEANDFMALMVNSLDQGLVVFDEDLNCNSMFTKACEPMFGISPQDRTIPELLDVTDESDLNVLTQWAKVLFSEMIPFESAVTLGPKNKITGTHYSDENYKFIGLNYYPMRDADEKIINIVMIATDKTTEVQATEIAKEKEAYVSMILKILNNKNQFESFISEVEEIFHQFSKTYSVSENTVDFELAMMLFHTLNGGFGIYSITKLQMQARGYETEISTIKESEPNPSEYIPFLQGHVESLKTEFYNFRIELDRLIGTKFSQNEAISEIPRKKILELKNIIKDAHNPQLLHYYAENFVKVPIINYFKAYDDFCKVTAVKINKEFHGLTFHNPDLKVEVEPFLEFFNVLVHLFRNCLDHGLEDANTREESGKSRDGHIEVSFEMIETEGHNNFALTVKDDGTGIDPDKIRARYLKIYPEANVDHLSDKEIIYKIFDPFFSTRDEVSALSGRGVGMSAIQEVVERLHGKVVVNSVVGQGSSFEFVIPVES